MQSPDKRTTSSSPRVVRGIVDDSEAAAGRTTKSISAGQQRRKREHEDDDNNPSAEYTHAREAPPPPAQQQQQVLQRQHIFAQHHHLHQQHHHHHPALHSYSHRPYSSSFEHQTYPPPSEHAHSASHIRSAYHPGAPPQRTFFAGYHHDEHHNGDSEVVVEGLASVDAFSGPTSSSHHWERSSPAEGGAFGDGRHYPPSYPSYFQHHSRHHHHLLPNSGTAVFHRSPAVRPAATGGAVQQQQQQQYQVAAHHRHSHNNVTAVTDRGYAGGEEDGDNDSVGPRTAQRPPRRDPYAPVGFRNEHDAGQPFDKQQVFRGSGGASTPGAFVSAPASNLPTDEPVLRGGPVGALGGRGDPAASPTSSTSLLVSLQREFDVLRQSFTELQKLYGEKCGEVILLRKTVESLQRQISWSPLNPPSSTTGGGGGEGGLGCEEMSGAGVFGGASERAPSAASSSCFVSGSSANKTGLATAVSLSGNRHSTTSPTQSHQPSVPPSAAALGAAAWKCEVCQLVLNSESVLEAHLRGQKHLRTVQRALRCGGAKAVVPTTSSTSAAVEGNRVATNPGANGFGGDEGNLDDRNRVTETAPPPSPPEVNKSGGAKATEERLHSEVNDGDAAAARTSDAR